MRIASCLNVTPEEVAARQHNIWIGVSLGNSYFTKENTREYIKWSLENTKERVLVVIPDVLHAVNLEVLDNRTPQAALRKAVKIGDEKAVEVMEIIDTLSGEDKKKISVVRWKDLLENEDYRMKLKAIKDEFEDNKEFHDFITDIVKSGRSDRSERLSKMTDEELDRLSNYVLYELPHFMNGVQGDRDDLVYTIIPYPGLNKLDDLAVGLCNGTMFVELSKKLNLSNKIGIVEAYVD
jgi:tRNA-dependent cyclodipeptide synthase